MQQSVKWKWKEEGKDLSLEVSIVLLSFLFFFLLLRTSLYRDSMKNVGRIEGRGEARKTRGNGCHMDRRGIALGPEDTASCKKETKCD